MDISNDIIINRVFRYLTFRDMQSFACVCKKYRDMLSQSENWKKL